ncbi:MutS protein msh4 [Kappamyces sp. JEL0680]|nr:MutS protein msh4 [Kappamyces sp. JEL0680]
MLIDTEAVIDLSTGIIRISQFKDTPCFTWCESVADTRTLSQIHVFKPASILTFQQPEQPSRMYQAIGLQIQSMSKVNFVARKSFNDTDGLAFISQFGIIQEGIQLMSGLTGNLFHYCQDALGVSFKLHSLNCIYQSLSGNALSLSPGTMMIDITTATHLELVANAISAKPSQSLIGLFRPFTKMGLRLLRTSMLQPLLGNFEYKEPILERHAAIADLLGNSAMTLLIGEGLKAFPDLDHLIGSLIFIPKSKPKTFAEASINRVLLFKQIIQQTLCLKNALGDASSPLLTKLRLALSGDAISAMLDHVERIINPDISYQKTAIGNRNQKCFAVRSGVNGLLDIARQTYKEANEDVNNLAASYGDTFGVPIKLTFSTGVGYSLQAAADDFVSRPIPAEAINVVKKGKNLQFSTMELSLDEIFALSESLIIELIVYIHSQLPSLYVISESIATLDMLVAFARYSATTNTISPEFADTLAWKNARHPVMETVVPSFVPNDAFADPGTRMQFITGTNMSGKSTYLLQIGQLQVLAQIGCYLPCEYASIRVADKLLTRIGSDSNAAQVSSFTAEMKETAFLLDQVTENSLVLIDELGRGTSVTDGVAVTIAVSEALLGNHAPLTRLESKSFCFFATHFNQVCDFFDPNPYCVSLHLTSNQEYKVTSGVCTTEHYGIETAKHVGLPEPVIQAAHQVSSHLQGAWLDLIEHNPQNLRQKKEKITLELANELLFIFRSSSLADAPMRVHLTELQRLYRVKLEWEPAM